MAIQYQIIPVTPFEQNCSLLWCDETKQAAVVDPGGDIARILAAVEKHGLKLERILVTHGHIDESRLPTLTIWPLTVWLPLKPDEDATRLVGWLP